MNRYEVIYIIDTQVDEAARQELITKFSDLVKSYGGEIEKLDEWGKRRLAYTIDYKNEGYYVLMHMQAEPTFPKELERNFDINENILR
jgi:small subunit ribosomal protein S6